MRIQGRTAVVTGGAAGIGRAAAVALARKGVARVVLVDVDDAGMAETLRQVEAEGAAGAARHIDLSDLSALVAGFEALEAEGGYDILYNNAGVVSGGRQFPTAGAGHIGFVMTINLLAPILATEIAARVLQARGGGVIVNTISTVALGQGFSDALYASSKAGLLMFNRCCAGLKDSLNVRVAGVLPGLTDTPILHKTGDGRAADWMAPILAGYAKCRPEDIAEAVILLIEDDSLAGGDWVAVRNVEGRIEHEWGRDAT